METARPVQSLWIARGVRVEFAPGFTVTQARDIDSYQPLETLLNTVRYYPEGAVRALWFYGNQASLTYRDVAALVYEVRESIRGLQLHYFDSCIYDELVCVIQECSHLAELELGAQSTTKRLAEGTHWMVRACATRLKKLIIRAVRFDNDLVSAVRACSELTTLQILGSDIHHLAYAPGAIVAACTKLQALTLHETSIYPGFGTLWSSLENCCEMAELDLQGVRIYEPKPFASAVSRFKNLKKLRLVRCSVTDECLLELGPALMNCPELCALSLDTNNITPGGLLALDQMCGRLVTLNLNYNRIGEGGGEILGRVLCKFPDLEALYLYGCDLRNKDFVGLARGIASCTKLQELDLSLNTRRVENDPSTFTDAGIAAIAAAFHDELPLHTLRLPSANFGDEGAKAIAGAMSKLKHLRMLQLDYNPIQDAGASALAWALRSCPTLTTLSMVSCSVGDTGAVELANGIVRLPHLESFLLDYNRDIRERGICALARAVHFSPTISRSVPSFHDVRVFKAHMEPRSYGYWEALAFFGGVLALKSTAKGKNHAKAFMDGCGDKAVPWRVVQMLVGG